MATVRELITRLGFDTDEQAVKRYDGLMGKLSITLAGVMAAATGVQAAIFGLAREQAARGDEIRKAAGEYGLTTDALQEMTFAFQRISRLSEREVSRSFERLSQSIAEARDGNEKLVDVFHQLGFSQQQIASGNIEVEDTFTRAAEAIRNADNRAAATSLAMELFGQRIGRRMVGPIRESSQSVDELRQRFRDLGGGMEEATLIASEEFEDALLDLRTVAIRVRDTLGDTLIPQMTQLMKNLTEWIRLNRAIIEQRLHRVLSVISNAADVVWRAFILVVGWIQSAVKWFGGFERTLRLVIIALGVIVSAKILGGIIALAGAIRAMGIASIFTSKAMKRIPIIALGVAIVALIDDIWAWVNGSESAIGKFLGTWEDFKDRVVGIFNSVREGFNDFINRIRDGAMMLGNAIRGAFEAVIPSWMLDAFRMISSGTGSLANRARDMLGLGNDSTVAIPEQDMGQAARQGRLSRDVSVRAEVSLQVPNGTSAEQRQALERQADAIFRDRLDRELQNAVLDFAPVE